MTKAEGHQLRIKIQRDELIKDIKTEMLRSGAQQIELHNPIIFSYIVDQTNEVISAITLDERVFLDSGYDMDVVSLQDLSTDQLIALLEIIELEQFEIDELIED